MINVSELMTDPDFAQPFEILRGAAGGFVDEGRHIKGQPVTLSRIGPVQPAKPYQMAEFLPEGERGSDAIIVRSGEEIICTDGEGTESDIILFNGNKYRVIGLIAWGAHGYWQAIAAGF